MVTTNDRPRLIHGRIETQAATRPTAPAVVLGDAALSYAELNARANRLARHLVGRGVGPDVTVGVHMERCLDLVVALLAVLKAGGGYLPLDPKYPADRIAFMLDDCRARVLIGDGTSLASVPFTGSRIDLTADANAIANESATDPARNVDPENLAYVIYTSGSTGRPKGVRMPHDRVIRLFTATEAWFQFTAHDVFSFWHSYAFDVSVFEIWGALMHGGSVVVVPEDARRSPDELLALLSARRVTVLSQIPSNFRHVVAAATAPGVSIPLALRTIILAGEAVDLRSLEPWFQRYGPAARIVNMYGTTETTVHATYREIVSDDCCDPKTSPIGIAIPDLGMHVLDPTLHPVNDGEDGEIYLGGAGLAHGYHDRAALTAERFVPDPFSGRPGARMYKTGDLARRLADGSFDYRGRNDAQVKIRGYRIETGEIAATLCTHPAVREAAVVARDVDGDRRLVAYVALTQPTSDEALREFLAAKLPSYMVPSAFVVVDALPLTPSGKIDIKALPAPDLASRAVSDDQAPRSETEVEIASMVAALLHVDRVGLRDNFLALGGHSLLAIKLVARLRARFDLEVSLGRFLANPTVAWLVTELAHRRDANTHAKRPIEAIPRQGILLASHAQERMWFVERMLRSDDERPFNVAISIAIRGDLDADVLARSFTEVIARHESWRTNFRLAGRRVTQVISPPFAIDLPAVNPFSRPDRDHELCVRIRELARPAFDLAKGRLVRTQLVRFAPDDHVLIIAVHHIVYDGGSLGVFVREIAALYEAFRAGRPSPLAPLTIQLVDIAHWQSHALAAEDEQSLAWWTHHLASAPTTELPADRPRPEKPSAAGARVDIRVPQVLAADARAFARHERSTLFVTAVAAFAVQLVRTGQTDLVLGTAVSVRDRPELETALGMLLDVLALRIDASGDPTFRELVQRVHRVVTDAFAHNHVSFEQIVAALKRKVDLGRAPLFQVALNLNTLQPFAAPTGQTWDIAVPDTGSVPYDLTIELTDTGDELDASFEYRTDLFEPATIERLAADFQTILRRGIEDPEQPISRLLPRPV